MTEDKKDQLGAAIEEFDASITALEKCVGYKDLANGEPFLLDDSQFADLDGILDASKYTLDKSTGEKVGAAVGAALGAVGDAAAGAGKAAAEAAAGAGKAAAEAAATTLASVFTSASTGLREFAKSTNDRQYNDFLRKYDEKTKVVAAMNKLTTDKAKEKMRTTGQFDSWWDSKGFNGLNDEILIRLEGDGGVLLPVQLAERVTNSRRMASVRGFVVGRLMTIKEEWSELDNEMTKNSQLLATINTKSTEYSQVDVDGPLGRLHDEYYGELRKIFDKLSEEQKRALTFGHTEQTWAGLSKERREGLVDGLKGAAYAADIYKRTRSMEGPGLVIVDTDIVDMTEMKSEQVTTAENLLQSAIQIREFIETFNRVVPEASKPVPKAFKEAIDSVKGAKASLSKHLGEYNTMRQSEHVSLQTLRTKKKKLNGLAGKSVPVEGTGISKSLKEVLTTIQNLSPRDYDATYEGLLQTAVTDTNSRGDESMLRKVVQGKFELPDEAATVIKQLVTLKARKLEDRWIGKKVTMSIPIELADITYARVPGVMERASAAVVERVSATLTNTLDAVRANPKTALLSTLVVLKVIAWASEGILAFEGIPPGTAVNGNASAIEMQPAVDDNASAIEMQPPPNLNASDIGEDPSAPWWADIFNKMARIARASDEQANPKGGLKVQDEETKEILPRIEPSQRKKHAYRLIQIVMWADRNRDKNETARAISNAFGYEAISLAGGAMTDDEMSEIDDMSSDDESYGYDYDSDGSDESDRSDETNESYESDNVPGDLISIGDMSDLSDYE